MVRRMYKVDVYLRVRRAVMVDGMSMREAARVFGLHRDTVRKMLAYSVPPGYRRQSPPRKPKLEPYTGVIDRILEDDLRRPRKQRHTAKRIFERLRDEYGFDGGYTTVKDYVRENRRQTREMFVPLSHPPGQAQCDFGEALVVIGGVEQKAHCTSAGLGFHISSSPEPRLRRQRGKGKKKGARRLADPSATSRWPNSGSGAGSPVAPAAGGIRRVLQAGRPGEFAVLGQVQDQRLLGAGGLRISGRAGTGLRRRRW